MSFEPTGINAANVTDWMAERIPDLAGPLDFELITGGASNLTFRVTDTAGGTWVLRRPPTGHVLASAHDMSREHRIIAALEGTGVPVPPAIGLCQDADVNGADFYVMGFVDGRIVFDHQDGHAYPEELRATLAESSSTRSSTFTPLIRPPSDSAISARRRTTAPASFAAGSARSTRDPIAISLFHDLHARLSGSIPDQQGAGIVHGDYRLDNCMAGHDGTIAAVLDWELCTLGDVLADLGAW